MLSNSFSFLFLLLATSNKSIVAEKMEGMNRHIVIDGLPTNIAPARHEVFRKFFTTTVAKKLGHENFVVHLTIDDDASSATSGFVNGAFLTFVKPSDAEFALSAMNRFPLTKSEMLSTYRWSALATAKEPVTEYVAPELAAETAADLANAMMQDPAARPMFLTKSGQHLDIELSWYDNAKQKVDLHKKPTADRNDSLGQMCEMDRRMGRMALPGLIYGTNTTPKPLPIWTPLGSMMVTQHLTGLKFWGGEDFKCLFEIVEENVTAFLISPLENFLIVRSDREVAVWNLKQSRKLKVIAGFNPDQWPLGKFNADDSLVAFNKSGDLLVYDTKNDMSLVQASIDTRHSYTYRLENLVDFEWSPFHASHIALIFSGDQHVGWSVSIEDIATDDERIASMNNAIRRNFLGAGQVNVLWHPEGTGLAAKITKFDKGGEVSAVEYCLFRIFAKSITADHFKIENMYSAERFAWQPGGKYFAVLLLDKASINAKTVTGPKMTVRFYSVDGKGLKTLGSFPTSANSLHWAPKGTRLVAANYEKSLFEFYGINDAGVAQQFEKCEHPAVGDTQWDPSGRFFASWNTCLRTPEGCRYRIFDMNGHRILEKRAEKFSHFAWRPLAKPVLDADEVNEVKKKLKSIIEEYEAADQAVEDAAAKVIRDKQEKAEREYKTRMDAIHRHHAEKKYAETREQLRAKAPMTIRQRKFLASIPEEQRMTTEIVTESRVKARDEVKGQK
ncbi:eukaryotic translation initiation factor eIF2A, putative [Bodo saltans]|uniref:Eukaryotic translation initiation factor eIF2A, putative n=1 Tax=Bodo saltans TaxID=75058 RepID=A0A0S4JDX9_BODSA|nr:eukaryotic translation initiation factor eIF2A, putative [Bodo saltans]|eukprot:CUG87197.1 eukaryotic translation initiation factor eIF2A, putative [Bodo saltans]